MHPCSVLEKEIAELIQSTQIQARIDSGSKVLYKRRSDMRAAVFSTAVKSGGLMHIPLHSWKASCIALCCQVLLVSFRQRMLCLWWERVALGVRLCSLGAAEEYIRETKAVLVRASLLRHDLIQKAPPGQRLGKVGGGGGSSHTFMPGPSGGWALDRESYLAGLSHVD